MSDALYQFFLGKRKLFTIQRAMLSPPRLPAYLAYMEANGYRNVLSLKMFGLGLPMMLKEYGLNYEKRHTKQGIQTNLSLKGESYGDWLPKCDDSTAI
ncbi:Zinc binding domain / DNA primase [Klebsiella pneumoniae]|nr:Zinc binding domain / DNA primase [Klebsiella pneumoniae]